MRYQSPEGDGGAGGGAPATTYTQAQVDAMIGGLKANTAEALAEKKAAQAKLKEFDGLDAARAREVLNLFDNNEEMKLIKEGKIDQVFQARTEKMTKGFQKQLEDQTAAIKAAEARAGKFSQRVLNDALRAAAMEAGVHKHAMEDVLLNGQRVFQFDDDGNAVQLEDGKPIFGKDGKTPFGPAEWLASIAEAKPHWFPAQSSGAPAGGKPNTGGVQRTMKRSVFMGLSSAEQQATIKTTKIID